MIVQPTPQPTAIGTARRLLKKPTSWVVHDNQRLTITIIENGDTLGTGAPW